MKSDKPLSDAMKKLKQSVSELKKLADEAGADIDTYSIEYKLYLEDKTASSHLAAAERRKKIFEENLKKENLFK